MKKEKVTKSRREFIKVLSGAAFGTAAASAVLTTGCSMSGAGTEWSATYDWICVGSGFGGCTAAIFGHDKGFKTLVLEKSNMIGGQTVQSAGLLWVPNNRWMKEAGIKDSPENGANYLRYIGGGITSEEHIKAFIENVNRAVEYLADKADFKFRGNELIEFFHAYSDGGWRLNERVEAGSVRQGRSLIPEPMPAETLGEWRNKVQYSHFYHALAESLEDQEHNPSLGRLTKNATIGPHIGYSGPIRHKDTVALALWKKQLGPKAEALLKKDEETRYAGAALGAYAFRAVMKRGIEVRTETSAERLLMENGRVVGVIVKHGGEEENLRANKGVVLATGGGGGWRLASQVGGEVYNATAPRGLISMAVPEEKFPNGSQATRANYELRMRHSMVVNKFGERFGDEVPYQALGAKLLHFDSHGEHRFMHIPIYLIFDRQAIEKYSFAGRPPGATEGLDWVAQGKTLAELAQKLNLPAAKLAATVSRFNESTRRGKDMDFSRRPETLGPIEKPPFYGVKLIEADEDLFRAGTSVVINTHGQAVHFETKEPIPGLYASGSMIAGDRIWGIGYQAGFQLTGAATFGLLIAEHAATAG